MGHKVHLQFAPAWPALGESYFVLGNWNLLWYGVLAVILLAGRTLLTPPLAPLTAIAAAGTLFVLALFAWLTLANGDQTGLADADTMAVANEASSEIGLEVPLEYRNIPPQLEITGDMAVVSSCREMLG